MPNNESEQKGPLFTSPNPKPSKITISEIAELRKVFEDSSLAKWVVLAGIGGLVELIRLIHDIAQYVHTKGF